MIKGIYMAAYAASNDKTASDLEGLRLDDQHLPDNTAKATQFFQLSIIGKPEADGSTDKMSGEIIESLYFNLIDSGDFFTQNENAEQWICSRDKNGEDTGFFCLYSYYFYHWEDLKHHLDVALFYVEDESDIAIDDPSASHIDQFKTKKYMFNEKHWIYNGSGPYVYDTGVKGD